jgi:hypothetical protein
MRWRCCDGRCRGRGWTGPTARCWPASRGCCPAGCGTAGSCGRARCCGGIGIWSAGGGRYKLARPAIGHRGDPPLGAAAGQRELHDPGRVNPMLGRQERSASTVTVPGGPIGRGDGVPSLGSQAGAGTNRGRLRGRFEVVVEERSDAAPGAWAEAAGCAESLGCSEPGGGVTDRLSECGRQFCRLVVLYVRRRGSW